MSTPAFYFFLHFLGYLPLKQNIKEIFEVFLTSIIVLSFPIGWKKRRERET
jgi:hypothetical protein